MKKAGTVFLVFILIVLSACSARKSSSSAEESAWEYNVRSDTSVQYKVGVLAPRLEGGKEAQFAYYAEKRCRELGRQIEYKLLESDDREEMCSQMELLRGWGAQAIVIYPYWGEMEAAVEACLDVGIQVVSAQLPIDDDRILLVEEDGRDIGAKSAQYLTGKLEASGRVILLSTGTKEDSQLREQSFQDKLMELSPGSKVEVYPLNPNRAEAVKRFTEILAATPEIDGVYAENDEVAVGAVQAIKAAERTDIKAVCSGGGSQEYLRMMEEDAGFWQQTVICSALVPGKAVDAAVALIQGEENRGVLKVPCEVADRENRERYLDENAPY